MCTVLGGASTGGVEGADGAGAGDGAEGGSLGALIRNRSVDGKSWAQTGTANVRNQRSQTS